MDRHARQSRLIGPDAQARVRAASVDVGPDGFAGSVAARYLAGAGVARLRVRTADIAAAARAIDPAIEVEVAEVAPTSAGGAAPAGFEHPVASEMALGALLALRALRSAIAVA
jgi:hypothetical protein